MPYKQLSAVLSAALIGRLAAASPLSNLEKIQALYARDSSACAPGNTPILYKEYLQDLCPPNHTMAADGSCPKDKPDPATGFLQDPSERCITYCEVRQMFTYDVEKPIDQPYCHGPLTCSVADSKATTYTYTYNVDPKFINALGLGITGGYSTAEATTTVTTKSVNLKDGECGYFTFLPILHHSCGSISQGKFGDVPTDHCSDYTTYGNICTTQAYRSADGKSVLGDTVFVKTNCGDRSRRPMNEQDQAYQHDGVALPQSVLTTFIDSHDTSKPPPPPAVTCPTSSDVTCKECPTGFENCSPLGTTGTASLCSCKAPCGKTVCRTSLV